MSILASNLETGPPQRLQGAYDFIERNLHRDDLTPASVAQALGISVRQLHTMFAPTGQSFTRYVLSRRLDLARLQLGRDPDRSIIEIVLACGIKSSSVFYRAFREAYGMTPSGYRQSLQSPTSGAFNGN